MTSNELGSTRPPEPEDSDLRFELATTLAVAMLEGSADMSPYHVASYVYELADALIEGADK